MGHLNLYPMYIIILTTALLGTVLVAAERRHHTGGIGSLVRHLNADPLSHLHQERKHV